MKRSIIALSILAVLFMSCFAWAAEDGAAIYKSKCAMCHGPDGAGKGAAPALKGTSLTADQISTELQKGADGKKAPHNKPINGLTADQATAVAGYVKSLK